MPISLVGLDQDPPPHSRKCKPASPPNQELKASSDYITITDQYLQKIGAGLGYDYILSYRVGGHMLYANPSLDITQEVIKYLNQEYKK